MAVAALWSRRSRPIDLLGVVACTNLLTHPIACLSVGQLGFWPTEAGVLLAEIAAYRWVAGLAWKPAAQLSLIANACSASLALFL